MRAQSKNWLGMPISFPVFWFLFFLIICLQLLKVQILNMRKILLLWYLLQNVRTQFVLLPLSVCNLYLFCLVLNIFSIFASFVFSFVCVCVFVLIIPLVLHPFCICAHILRLYLNNNRYLLVIWFCICLGDCLSFSLRLIYSWTIGIFPFLKRLSFNFLLFISLRVDSAKYVPSKVIPLFISLDIVLGLLPSIREISRMLIFLNNP